MREKDYIISALTDLRDCVDRTISAINSFEFTSTNEVNFAPLYDREYLEHRQWPSAGKNRSRMKWMDRASLIAEDLGYDFDGRVLEYVNGSSPAISECYNCEAEVVIAADYNFDINEASLHKSFRTVQGEFDYAVIIDSLSFVNNPAEILTSVKRHIKSGKLVLRVRPWTSPSGGFQESYHNFAYSHLLQDLPHNDLVKWRVINPLLEYDRLITDCGFISLTRNIKSLPLTKYLQEDCEAFEILKERTWGEIDSQKARAILKIKHIDYCLMVA